MIEQGTATDVYDLLDKLSLFATSAGWTVNASTSDELYVSSGADFWALKATDNIVTISADYNDAEIQHPGIACHGARGYSGAAAWNEQPGAYPVSQFPILCGVFHQTDIKEYYFLSNSANDYIHVLLRRDTTRWALLLLGRASAMQKFGTWNGGQYTGGHVVGDDGDTVVPLWDGDYDAAAQVQADIDGLGNTSWHVSRDGNPAVGHRVLGTFRGQNSFAFDLQGRIADCKQAAWSGRAPMIPLMVFLDRSGNETQYCYGGALPDVRHMWHDSILNGTEFIVGSDTWLFLENFAFRLIP